MPATSNLLSEAVNKWNRVHARATQLGIPLSAYQKLGQDDIARVSQGHQGMSQQEAELAVLAAAKHPTIIGPERRTNPLSILGNVPKDLEDIIRGLNPPTLVRNLYREGKAAVNYDYSQIGREHQASGLLGQTAEALRQAATVPIVRMVPGVRTLAGLTTSGGRKDIERHPLGTALDVLPLALGVGKAVGELSAATSPVQEIAATATEPAMNVRVVPPAVQQLQQGHLLRAAEKTIPDVVRQPLEAKATAISRALKVDPETRALWRHKAEMDTETLGQVHKIVDERLVPLLGHLSEEERAQLFHETTDPQNYPNPSPEHAALIPEIRTITRELGELGIKSGKLSPVDVFGHELLYSTEGAEGKVVQGLRKSAGSQTRMEAAERVLNTTKTRLARRSENLTKLIDREHEKIQNNMGRGQGTRLRQAQQRLFRHEEKLKALQSDPVLLRRQARYDAKLSIVHARNRQLMERFINTAPAAFHPMLEAEIRSRATIKATGMYEPGPQLESALAKLEQGTFSHLYSTEEWTALTKEVRQTWTTLIAHNLDPVWVHSVREHQFQSATKSIPIAERYITPASVRAKSFNLQPRLTDVGVGLVATASEYLRSAGTERMIDTYVRPFLMDNDAVTASLSPQLAKEMKAGISPIRSVATTLDRLRTENFERFDPEAMWNFSTPKLRAMAKESELFLPKHIANAVKEMTRPADTGAVGRAARRTTTVFKTSVMAFSPRHMAHVTFGGATMLLHRGHIEDWKSIGAAIEYARNPFKFPSAISHGLDPIATDQLFAEAAGNTMGTIWTKIVGAEKAFYKAQEFVADTQRAMAYLGGKERGLKLGMDDVAAEQLGIQHANKVFIDWNGMTPYERTIIRQVFPFYGFTRHILGYVLTYPIDHPIRASILANFAENEQKDWDTSLPRTFQNLFYLGQPDKMGNVKAIDTRTFNPFRDVASYFTLRGFFSSIHPIAQGFLQAGGVNPLTGSPSLYNELTIDEATGKLVAKRPSGLGLRFAEGIIPEIGTLDHYIGLTADLRNLKTTNPTAYRKQLFNTINMVFVPYQYNLPAVRGKDQMTRFRLAQQAVSQATINDSWANASRFNLVPYEGRLVDPGALEAAWRNAAAALASGPLAGVNPKAVLPRPSGKKPSMLTPQAIQAPQ